jgi:hypothetical protein
VNVGTAIRHIWWILPRIRKLSEIYSLHIIYKAFSKKDRTFAIKTLFYSILSSVHFKAVPSTGDTPSPTFLPLLKCFLERTFCDGAQFSYRIFLNLCAFKKRLNFLNSAPTSKEGALRLLSAPSGRFWQQTAICPASLWALVVELHPLNWARTQAVRRINPAASSVIWHLWVLISDFNKEQYELPDDDLI